MSRVFEIGTVRPSVCMSIRRPSTKNFFDFSDIWHVGRDR